MKITVIILAIIVVGLVVFIGVPKSCTYYEIGQESLISQIDQAIGEYRVKRKEAENGIERLENSVEQLREGRVKAQVKSEQLTAKLENINNQKISAQNSLRKLRDLIARDDPATLAGKKYSVTELQTMSENYPILQVSGNPGRGSGKGPRHAGDHSG